MTESVGADGFLAGERVALLPLGPEHAPLLVSWMNDDETTCFMFTGQRPANTEQLSEEIRRQVASAGNVVFLLIDRATGTAIGYAGLYDIHPTARKAEFRILIGAKEFWNKGCGTEATELLTYYGFDRLNLNKVWLGVTDGNAGGLRAYQKAGFREEGRLRQELYRNSRYYDAIRMSMLREEYYQDLFDAHRIRFGGRP